MENIQERSTRLDGMKVLMFEDMPLNMEIAKFMLDNKGIEVTTAEIDRLPLLFLIIRWRMLLMLC